MWNLNIQFRDLFVQIEIYDSEERKVSNYVECVGSE